MKKRTAKRTSTAKAKRAAAPRPEAGAPPPLDLKAFRDRIDGIDEQIHRLLNERAVCAKQVGASKQAQGLHTADFYRPEREAQVLRNVVARNKGPLRNCSGKSCLRASRRKSR